MYRIIIDSCGELFSHMKGDEHFTNVPLTLEVDGVTITDDESFDQADFISRVKASAKGPKSSCPSPGAFLKEIKKEAERIYIVTLSSRLSGSYNSALVAKRMYEEENGDDKEIHVFDSCSASIGESLIGMKVDECEKKGMSFDKIVSAVESYITEQHTFFCLETLETLRKAGRLSAIKEMIANTLHIKPVMGSTPEGEIQKLAQVRGMNKALAKMAECMVSVTKNCGEKVLAISHCNCYERAMKLKEEVEKRASFKDIFVVDTNGVSTMYANDGGLIMVV